MTFVSDPLRPNREIALRMIRQMRRDHVENARRKVRDTLRRSGCSYTQTVGIYGLLTSNAERDIRSAIAKSWGCSRLRVVLNSPGGLGGVGERLADDLREMIKAGVRVETHVERSCCSAAVLPFVVGQERSATKRAFFVIHQRALERDYAKRLHPSNLRKLADQLDKRDNEDLEMLEARGVRLPTPWQAAFRRGEDIKLDALDAFRVGLVHVIR